MMSRLLHFLIRLFGPASERPRFRHDCTACTFLGQWVDPHGERFDLYHCEGGLPGGSAVARYGGDGPDYSSSPFVLKDALIKAHAKHGTHGTDAVLEAMLRWEKRREEKR